MRTDTVSSLRQRMIEDMNARKLGSHTQRSHISSCKRFAAFLKRSPDTATAEDIRQFQLHLSQTSVSICNRNRIMTGLRFLFRVTLRRLDLAAGIYHIREPQKIPLVISPDETRRLLAVANNLKVRTLLGLGYGCGLRAGEVVRLKVKHIDKAQKIIRVEQSKGRKDRNVMLSPETFDLLRQWWKVRPSRHDATTPLQERWLFPGRRPGKPMTTRQLSRLFHEAADAAGIKKRVTLHATDASTPACTVAFSPKAIASNSALQSPQASPRGQIPIASAAPPPPTSRDFVPWRFSDAGRHSAWMASSCRRPRNLHKSRLMHRSRRHAPSSSENEIMRPTTLAVSD
jgi:site-specific recombinase XerD